MLTFYLEISLLTMVYKEVKVLTTFNFAITLTYLEFLDQL